MIAGSARGRRLKTLPGRQTRPTAGRVKESLFNQLAPVVPGARVLDLFAGAGNLGIEALSRGARSAVFIDASPRCQQLIRENLAALGLADRGRVLGGQAGAALARLGREGERFDLIFLDPPYGQGWVPVTLRNLADTTVGMPGAMVVAEHRRDDPVEPAPPGFRLLEQRRYGETILSFFLVEGSREVDETGEFPTDKVDGPSGGGE